MTHLESTITQLVEDGSRSTDAGEGPAVDELVVAAGSTLTGQFSVLAAVSQQRIEGRLTCEMGCPLPPDGSHQGLAIVVPSSLSDDLREMIDPGFHPEVYEQLGVIGLLMNVASRGDFPRP